MSQLPPDKLRWCTAGVPTGTALSAVAGVDNLQFIGSCNGASLLLSDLEFYLIATTASSGIVLQVKLSCSCLKLEAKESKKHVESMEASFQ